MGRYIRDYYLGEDDGSDAYAARVAFRADVLWWVDSLMLSFASISAPSGFMGLLLVFFNSQCYARYQAFYQARVHVACTSVCHFYPFLCMATPAPHLAPHAPPPLPPGVRRDGRRDAGARVPHVDPGAPCANPFWPAATAAHPNPNPIPNRSWRASRQRGGMWCATRSRRCWSHTSR